MTISNNWLKIAGWLLDPDQKDLSLEALVRRFLRKEFSLLPEPKILEEFYLFLKKKIEEYGLKKVLEDIEMPLVPVLAAMEKDGIGINRRKIEGLNRQADQELKGLTKRIYEAAGTTFNINSPKQIAEIVFQKLGLKPSRTRKTETGRRSTSEQTLQEIKNEHPIIGLILEYRETFKIKSTYLEPLLRMVKKDGRIHTHFVQAGTATGRLTSEKPNLQNIPQSSKWAQPLRDAFEAGENWSFLSFDFSQIELRILAQETNDPKLRGAFSKNLDIHQLTASQIFNVPFEKVTPEMRRLGKTLNFGIIYGMGAATLAQQSNLNKTEAAEFIKEYFNNFPQIKIWQEKIKTGAKTTGFVKNANGRRRWFLQLISDDPRAQAEAERAAINMPIQSLEADIIKMAMIKTFNLICERGWYKNKAKLILSIHDELLFEIKDDILKLAAVSLKEIMEKVYPLSMPLKVEVKYGKTWGDLKSFSES